jgi:hypothetical protein
LSCPLPEIYPHRSISSLGIRVVGDFYSIHYTKLNIFFFEVK